MALKYQTETSQKFHIKVRIRYFQRPYWQKKCLVIDFWNLFCPQLKMIVAAQKLTPLGQNAIFFQPSSYHAIAVSSIILKTFKNLARPSPLVFCGRKLLSVRHIPYMYILLISTMVRYKNFLCNEFSRAPFVKIL